MGVPYGGDDGDRPFRFFDNREKYLLFVTTCNEKWVIAERVGMELEKLAPRPPALRLFDAGMGDATVLTRVMRCVHFYFPAVPVLAVAKEISVEDVRLGLEKMPDRFVEHPETVLVVTNMRYSEAPMLRPDASHAGALNWHEVALSGDSAYEFDEQIKGLQSFIADGWRARTSESSGNPVYVVPSVMVIYREDRRFVLDSVIPRRGSELPGYDLVVASQPYRARMPAEGKVGTVLAPLSRALAPGGRMIAIQSTGRDPGMEIIRTVWPEEDPFQVSRQKLVAALRQNLGEAANEFRFHDYPDHRSEFRFNLQCLPGEVGNNIGTSTLLAAWNAAVYVAQIEDVRLAEVLRSDAYLQATWDVLQTYGGLWFVDESFVVERLQV
ncbi:MAG: hypothetical protein QF629_03620 [Alphaproteobacteria bacterium]|jgi:hypothetical protein|nr:hypothetical protein [Alphaproteobacteria bacterium]MDP6238258.1 hypothetical protein [Alphaproteobacteria bacterium]MDP7172485.1 hypothetical protein [Alphaproteobacteria bacterium]MDP7233773.1 hypothetical protein [Alphaproteobacteria bacterium]MDP7487432.1 hypothetical protein [Alphaproteobacteria bacterium]|tara:strand:+ start:2104 stop:3249 length:1146 start_codon:yes stop_codon:yes gene_type:complete